MKCKLLFIIGAIAATSETTSGQDAIIAQKLVVTHVTSRVAHAGTDDRFSLRISMSSGAGDVRRFPNLPSNERERGRRDIYNFDITSLNLSPTDLIRCNLFMRTHGHNAWLPSSIKVVAKLSDGTSKTLVNRDWPKQWFSRRQEVAEDGFPHVSADEWDLSAPAVPQPEYAKRFVAIHETQSSRTGQSSGTYTPPTINTVSYFLANKHRSREITARVRVISDGATVLSGDFRVSPRNSTALYSYEYVYPSASRHNPPTVSAEIITADWR